MQPGERSIVEARDTIVLHVADAGAFAYAVNGVPGRRLGEPGEVVTVEITREKLRTLRECGTQRPHRRRNERAQTPPRTDRCPCFRADCLNRR